MNQETWPVVRSILSTPAGVGAKFRPVRGWPSPKVPTNSAFSAPKAAVPTAVLVGDSWVVRPTKGGSTSGGFLISGSRFWPRSEANFGSLRGVVPAKSGQPYQAPGLTFSTQSGLSLTARPPRSS
jgi:hypothetical protein